jgi:hypothetical protein
MHLHRTLQAIALATIPVVGACLVWILYPARALFTESRATVQASMALVPKAGSAVDGIASVEARLQGTLDFINRPCNTYDPTTHLLLKDGTLCVLAETSTRLGDIAVTSQRQVLQGGQLIAVATDNLNQVGQHIDTAVDAFAGTARAATTAVNNGTDYFQSAQPRLDLLLTHVDGSITRANALMDSPNAARAGQGLADLSVNSARFMLTADQVEEKFSRCTLHPTLGCVAKSYGLLGAQLFGYASPGIPK